MVSSCWAPGCSNRLVKGSAVKMFRFPQDPVRRSRWIVRVGRQPAAGVKSTRKDGLLDPKDHDRLCSAHFVNGKPSQDELDVDFVPSIFSHIPLHHKTPEAIRTRRDRQNRIRGRDEKKSKSAAADALLSLMSVKESTVPEQQPSLCDAITFVSSSVQTDIRDQDLKLLMKMNEDKSKQLKQQENLISKLLHLAENLQRQSESFSTALDEMKIKVEKLTKENEMLKEKVKLCFSFQMIENNDQKTIYYTGLPNYKTFETIFHYCSKIIRKQKRSKLDGRDDLLMTLVKLRHNIGFIDLANRFGVSKGLINKAFHQWLNALYRVLGGLIMWPPLDKELQLPEVFQTEKFRRVKCIIDCTEIFIERPSALRARAQTYSNYKKSNTIKLLVGISPSGAVTFLSDCWGGRASDKKITLQSGIMSKLLPGDIVMADRGFTMKDEFAQMNVKLIVPAYTKGKKQLTAEEVETGRELSRARIHVERVIGRLKDFKIISGTMPISFVKGHNTCKKVLTVVSGIINMHQPIL